jgi:hypothetical protein
MTRRARLAPSAERTAISRRRPRPRARSSPARFAQAISRTHPAAPISTSSSIRVLPTVSSRMGTTTAPIFWLLSGYSVANWRAIAFMSSRAWASETPGLRRATTFRKCELRSPSLAGERWIGIQKSISRSRNANSRGMIPMILDFSPLIRISRSITPAEPA